MRPRRLSRRAIPLSVGSVALPALATWWLLFDLAPPPPPPVTSTPSSGATFSSRREPALELLPVEGPTPDLPLDLLHSRLSGARVQATDLRRVARDGQAGAGARYAALRQLADQGDAIQEAEAIVLSAADDPHGRFLATNALGILARAPGGQEALRRCEANAPTPALRRSAGILRMRLARQPPGR